MKALAALLFVIAAGLLGWWGASYSKVPAESRSLFTQESYFQDVEQKDDFGDVVKKRTEIKQYTPGLLDVAGPAAGAAAALGVGLLWLASRKKRAA